MNSFPHSNSTNNTSFTACSAVSELHPHGDPSRWIGTFSDYPAWQLEKKAFKTQVLSKVMTWLTHEPEKQSEGEYWEGPQASVQKCIRGWECEQEESVTSIANEKWRPGNSSAPWWGWEMTLLLLWEWIVSFSPGRRRVFTPIASVCLVDSTC
jgi:hypothetical protein